LSWSIRLAAAAATLTLLHPRMALSAAIEWRHGSKRAPKSGCGAKRSAASFSRLRIGFQATGVFVASAGAAGAGRPDADGSGGGRNGVSRQPSGRGVRLPEGGPGRGQGRWRIRAGRQASSFGDERLAGANRTQRFDAIRDLFWKRVANERTNLLTPGFRLRGELGHGFDAVMESAVQRGSTGGLASEAWAAYHEIGYRIRRQRCVSRSVTARRAATTIRGTG
jgi:hypothetical protein